MNKLNNYILTNPETKDKSQKIIKLSDYEARVFNNAYATNGASLKYVKIKP